MGKIFFTLNKIGKGQIGDGPGIVRTVLVIIGSGQGSLWRILAYKFLHSERRKEFGKAEFHLTPDSCMALYLLFVLVCQGLQWHR